MFNKQLLNKFKNLNTPFYYYDLDILNKNIYLYYNESYIDR